MSRDLRKFARETNLRLIIGGLVIVFVVGDGLIYLFLGEEPAILGLLCLGVGIAPIFLVWVVLWGIAKVVERSK